MKTYVTKDASLYMSILATAVANMAGLQVI